MFWTSASLRPTVAAEATYNRQDVVASLQPPVAAEATCNGKDVAASWKQEYYVRRCGVTCHCCCGSLEADWCGSGKFRLLTTEPVSGRDGDLRNPCNLAESVFQACSQQREARHWIIVHLPFSSFLLYSTGVLVPTARPWCQ